MASHLKWARECSPGTHSHSGENSWFSNHTGKEVNIMTIEKPAITVLGPATALVLHNNGAKASPGGDGGTSTLNCSLGEIDD